MSTPKIPRNLHVMLIVFIGTAMLIGFLVKSLSETKLPEIKPIENKDQAAPDQGALMAEIRKQNEAALKAAEDIKRREAELEKARLALEQERLNALNKKPEAVEPDPKKDAANEKLQARKEAAAVSSIVAMRGNSNSLSELNLGSLSGSVLGGAAQSSANGATGLGAGNAMEGLDARINALMSGLSGNESVQNAKPQNETWLANQKGVAPEKPVQITSAHSGRVVHEGTVISAVLMSKVNSDLPGMITATVRSNVYDTSKGMQLAIPAGSKVIGKYNTDVSMGQKRVMAAFHRIILPDGRSIHMKSAAGADAQGASGLYGDVDNHLWEMLGTQMLVATVAWLAEDGASKSGTTVNISGGQQSSFGEILVGAAKTAAKPYEGMKPTLNVEPGTVFNIIANQDILLGE